LIPFNILTIVFGGLVGYYWFGESLGLRKIIAYAIIMLGVLMLVSKN
jgi:multidrug transporter EmrE-like cation transporter